MKKLKFSLYAGFCCLMLISVSCMDTELTDFADQQVQDEPTLKSASIVPPSSIEGVKWRQHADEEFMQHEINWWLNKPAGTGKPDVLDAIESRANAVVIRVDREDRFISPDHWELAMDEIVHAMTLAKNNNNDLGIYLWARIWFEKDGEANYGNVENGAIAVRDWFTPILDKAKDAGVLDMIHGIALVEGNCDRIQDVKKYAKRICDKFNVVSNWDAGDGTTFFRTRTLLMSGAGFGLDFRNVDNDGGEFLRVMQGRVKYFGFLYKYMRATHETVTYDDYYNQWINGVKRTWDDMERNWTSFSVNDRKTFLKRFGLDDLTGYVSSYKNTYPTTSNIVFWGDKWDGISKIPPYSRQALHSLLVKGGGSSVVSTNKGYFFDLAASDTENTAARKFYLFDGDLNLSSYTGWSGISVGDEWLNWNTSSPGY